MAAEILRKAKERRARALGLCSPATDSQITVPGEPHELGGDAQRTGRFTINSIAS